MTIQSAPGSTLDWNALKVFLAIARSGSLSGAARRLQVNHSTVFRRLKAFENDIGGRLFDRLDNRYELSALGQELLALSREIEASFQQIDRHLVGKDVQPRGTVKITAPHNIACRFLPSYLSSFARQYPDIRVELLVSNQEFNMNNRQADIAVRATPSPPEHLVGRRVGDIPWGVYAGRGLESERPLPSSLPEIGGHTLIGATGAMRALPAFVWLEQHHGESIHSRCDDLTAMSCLAQAGRGLALLPDDQQRPELLRLFDLEPGRSSSLWLLTHPDLRNVERIRLVMQHLGECFARDWPTRVASVEPV